MSILDKRVSEDDIQRVNEVRHHPKYERGFEKECREEKVWYMKGENGLPVGYFMFEDVQEQFDRWQAKKRQNGEGVGQGSVVESRTVESRTVESRTVESGVNKEHRVKKQTIFDKITDKLLEYAGLK